jgi:hypothetical protein
MPRRGNQSNGRIQVHERTVDDRTDILHAGAIAEEHTNEITVTEQSQMEDRTRKEYRNRIRHIYRWWKDSYPEYYEIGTVLLNEEDKKDTVAFHNTNDRDLVYAGLNVAMVKSFLSVKKKKRVSTSGDTILSSVSDIKKYDDAIKWGSQRANQPLPSTYYREMNVYIQAYKKEHRNALKNGLVDEQESDPVTGTLFGLICQWAIEAGNVFVWVFSLAMWNLMSRCSNIDSLAFHHIKPGTSDALKFRFDETKTDKTGEFVQEKNCYANPFKPHLCFFLALGCWISLNADKLKSTEKLFLNEGKKAGSASQRYCSQLIEMVSKHFETARRYLRLSHFSAHGIRKGSGSYASSATTSPPSFVAVAARGEWSIGKVLDVYFKFAMGGDQYLGRLLAFLDPKDDSFSTLPPHWKDPTHPIVLEGLKVAFGDVLESHCQKKYDPSGILSLLLASLVHHSNWLHATCAKHPDHPFHAIPLLDRHDLLADLKDQVTLEANEHMPISSGVPPHVDLQVAIKEVLGVCIDTHDTVEELGKGMKTELKTSIFEAIDEKVKSDGGVNGAILTEAMHILKGQIFGKIDQMSHVQQMPTIPDIEIPTVEDDVHVAGPFSLIYQGSAWCVPESFQFPAGAIRRVGWRKWLKGGVHIDGGKRWVIKPYRKFIGRDLPSKALSTQFQSEWRPIFCKMMETPGLEIPTNQREITEEFLESSYELATDYLRSCASYIFKVPPAIVADYTVGTWSKKVKRSFIKKFGTQEDIARLPPATARNRSRLSKRPIQRKEQRQTNKVRKKGHTRKGSIREQVEDEFDELEHISIIVDN